ncbi:monocarboxylate transporter 13-like [Glandiceps talaboti]
MADERSPPSRGPPDGGWGWVVVFASFFNFALTVGSMNSFGVLYVGFLDAFGESKSKTAWVGAIFIAILSWTTSLGVALARRIGHQKTVMLGGFLVFLGLFTSSFANHLVVLFFTYGIITGIGCGLAYVTSIEIVSIYFKRRLSVAVGIALSGVGAGQFALSLASQYFLNSYGWRGTLLILSALALNICVTGALMWPLRQEKSPEEQMNETTTKLTSNEEHGSKDGEYESEKNENCDEQIKPECHAIKPYSEKRRNRSECFLSCISVLIDLSLLHEPVYWFQIFIAIGQGFSNGPIIIHMVRRARDYGLSDAYSALIPAAMGLTQIIARSLWGAIGHIHGLRVNIPYGISMAICGVITIVSTYTRTFAGQIVFIVFYGISTGGFRVFLPLVVSSFNGAKKIGYGTSLLYQIVGFTALLISPLAGWIRDETGVYDWAFWIAGIAILVAAVLAFLLPVVEKVVERKRQRKAKYREETNTTDEDPRENSTI